MKINLCNIQKSRLFVLFNQMIANPKSARIFLFIFSILISMALLAVMGFSQRGGDSKRYIRGAENLLNGTELSGKQGSYPGYILVIAAVVFLQIDMGAVYIIQALAAAFATLALYEIGRSARDNLTGFIAAILFAANPDVAKWQGYLLTDSLYTSFVVLSAWLIYSASRSSRWWRYLIAVPVIIFTALIRPNGWLLVIGALIYWISQIKTTKLLRFLVSLVLLGAIVFSAVSIPALNSAIQRENPDAWLKQGIIIWGYNDWMLTMPVDASGTAGWSSSLAYVAKYPLQCLGLALLRIAVEIIHVRPYYSILNNSVLTVVYLVLYTFAIAGIQAVRSRRDLFALLGYIIVSQLLLVGITFADWDGRFLVYILPEICVFSAAGFTRFLETRTKSALTRSLGGKS